VLAMNAMAQGPGAGARLRAQAKQMWGYRDLFLLGVAFLLLETKSVTGFALLFGTTWIVNAFVFAGVLIAVLAAVELTARVPTPPVPIMYALLLGSLLLAWAVPADLLMPRLVTASAEEAAAFFTDALAHGHEGVVVKSLTAPYAAGRRGAGWIKVKPRHTLDLVVLAVEWGHGRRRGWLSNLHLGARDPDTGGFVMLGKTFKGLTDELLTWQTSRLLGLEERRDSYTVYVRPELVVEIAFDGVQRSPRYPGGLALRFARVLRYREDKTAAEADTIDTIRALSLGYLAPEP